MEGFYDTYSLVQDCEGMISVEVRPEIPLGLTLALLDQVTPFVESRFKVRDDERRRSTIHSLPTLDTDLIVVAVGCECSGNHCSIRLGPSQDL